MKKLWAVSLVFLLFVGGCGGSSSSTTAGTEDPPASATVSGVAAAGAPLAGYVSLVDSQGNPTPALSTLLANDGGFTFDVTGLVPPFYLEAEGVAGNTDYRLHSVVTAAGTANVNPLTEAQVAAATGQDPAGLYADPAAAGVSNEAMQAALEQAATDLQTMLAPLLDAWQAPVLNPITDVYVADGTGLDAVFDATDISVADNEIRVVDRASQTTLAAATVDAGGGGMTTTDPISTEEATQSATVANNLQQISSFLGEWLTAMKTISADFAAGGYPSGQQAAFADMAPYYTDAQSFGINNGQTRDQELAGTLEDYVFFNAIQALSNVGITHYDSVGGVYMVNFVLTLQLDGASALYPVPAVAVVKEGDAWKITGNGYYAGLNDMDLVGFQMVRNLYPEQTTTTTVIDFDLDDDQRVFSSATATGPGLPAAGITFLPNQYDWSLVMDESLMACVRFDNDGSCMERKWNAIELADETIAAMPQVCTYTLTFHFADGRPAEVHTVTAPAKPLVSSALTGSHFPAVHTSIEPTIAWAETNLIGQTLNVRYSTPTAIEPLHVGMGSWLDYQNLTTFEWGNMESWTDQATLGANQTTPLTTAALPAGSALQWGEFEISVDDTLWREYMVKYNFR